ncbi:MAG: hypothetical protein COA79_01370 [Planctomycetota bacterium]|nr:MAG: hypothetical protein COA79_01370 [Planctomycetota bacterium]
MTPLIDNALLAIQERGNHKNATLEMLDRLHKAGEKLIESEIIEWAIMNGWDKQDAERLGVLASMVVSGDVINIEGYPHWGDHILSFLMD